MLMCKKLIWKTFYTIWKFLKISLYIPYPKMITNAATRTTYAYNVSPLFYYIIKLLFLGFLLILTIWGNYIRDMSNTTMDNSLGWNSNFYILAILWKSNPFRLTQPIGKTVCIVSFVEGDGWICCLAKVLQIEDMTWKFEYYGYSKIDFKFIINKLC
jgi:hypothetical protein